MSEQKEVQEAHHLFPLDKILTVSAGDYMNRKGANIDYEMQGVHHMAMVQMDGNPLTPLMEGFAKKVPAGAEAVVGYRVNMAHLHGRTDIGTYREGTVVAYLSGTAVIKKER